MAERSEPIKVSVREFRGKLSDYLRQARQGARFLIVSRGQPMAEIGAPSEDSGSTSLPRRPLGLMQGEIWIADDFDETPAWLSDAMEGKDDPDW